jgi:hypothetical protein
VAQYDFSGVETEQRSLWLPLEKDNKKNGEIYVQMRYVPDLQTQTPGRTSSEDIEFM